MTPTCIEEQLDEFIKLYIEGLKEFGTAVRREGNRIETTSSFFGFPPDQLGITVNFYSGSRRGGGCVEVIILIYSDETVLFVHRGSFTSREIEYALIHFGEVYDSFPYTGKHITFAYSLLTRVANKEDFDSLLAKIIRTIHGWPSTDIEVQILKHLGGNHYSLSEMENIISRIRQNYKAGKALL